MGPKSNDKYPYKRKKKEDLRDMKEERYREGGNVTMEAETGVM